MDDKKDVKENNSKQEVQEKITRRDALKRIALSIGGIGLFAAFPSSEGVRAEEDPGNGMRLAYYSWYSSYRTYTSYYYSSYYSSRYSSTYYSYVSYSGYSGPSRGGCLTPKGG